MQWTEEDVRQAARVDPAIFASVFIGRGALPRLHRDLHGHINSNPDCAIELPRGHGKTVEVSLSWVHRIARAAVEHPEWPIPRLKVVTSNDDEAQKSGRFLRDIFESASFRWVFPEIRKTDWWNIQDFRIENANVRMAANARDATVEAQSVMGRAGGRWDFLWPDDVCDLQNSILKPAMRAQVSQAIDNTWMKMRDKSSPHGTRSIRTYTPWHVDDQGMKWRKKHAANGTLFRRPVVDFVSPWPEAFDEEYLRSEHSDGPIAYARAYELVPVSSDQLVFRPEWLLSNLWDTIDQVTRETSQSWLALDFAFTEKSASKPDPDWSVCHFARIDRNRRVRIMETLRMRADFPTFAAAVKAGAKRHGVRRGKGEAVAGQIGLVQQLGRDIGIPIDAVTRTKDKFYRATECQGQVKRGDLLLHAGSEPGSVAADQACVFEELCAFPAGSHDDACDPIFDLLDEARSGMVFEPPRPQAPRPAAPSWSLPGAGTGAFALPGSGVAW